MDGVETRNQDYDWRVTASVASILPKVRIHWGSERDSVESGLSSFLFAKRRWNPRVPHDARVVDNTRTYICCLASLESDAGCHWENQRETVFDWLDSCSFRR